MIYPLSIFFSFYPSVFIYTSREEVSWSTVTAASSIKGKRDFHKFVMNVVVQNVAHLKKEVQSGNMSALKQSAKLARLDSAS